MDDAHDLTQETCLKIMKHIRNFERKASFRTWAYRIAYNESLQFLRSRREHVDLDVVEPYLGATDDYGIDERDRGILVRSTIDRLSETDKSIILFYYYDELKIREISDILEINENTVKTRLSRSKKFLQAHLEHL